jgi:hypothetical protein
LKGEAGVEDINEEERKETNNYDRERLKGICEM